MKNTIALALTVSVLFCGIPQSRADGPTKDLYHAKIEVSHGDCFFGNSPDVYDREIDFGPRNEKGECIDNPKLRCFDKFFAFIESEGKVGWGEREEMLCPNGYPNCVNVFLGFENDEQLQMDMLRFTFMNKRNNILIDTKSTATPIVNVLDQEREYILTQDGCRWTKLKYLISRRYGTYRQSAL